MPCNECSRLPIEQNTENMEKEGTTFQSRKESNKQDEVKREGAHNVVTSQTNSSVYGIFRNLTFRYTQVKDYDLLQREDGGKVLGRKHEPRSPQTLSVPSGAGLSSPDISLSLRRNFGKEG